MFEKNFGSLSVICGEILLLFQGAFQAMPVDKDEYLLHLSCYIHLNPVKAGLVKLPQNYIYSSYLEYVGARDGTLPHPEIVLSQFATSKTSEVPKTSEVYERYRSFTEDSENEWEGLISHLLFDLEFMTFRIH